MKERGVGTPWSADEDSLLTQAVAIHGECDNWKKVALSVPGRTNKACRKRWLHSLSPSIKKTAWTPEEDQLLLNLYDTHGAKWSVIARKIPGRTDDACSKRYREALDPSLKKDEWTDEEDRRLVQVYNRLGGKWGEVGRDLNRSGLACRNRWRMLERKKASASRDVSTTQHSSPSIPNMVADQLPIPPPIPWPPEALPSIPIIEPNQYWDSHSADYSRMIPTNTVQQTSPFLPTHFSPLSEATQELHSSPPSPPPFQFTSSSLSSALSIPHGSQSPHRLEIGPPGRSVSPAASQSTPLPALPNADFHDFVSSNSPPHDTIDDPMPIDIERPTYDTGGYGGAEPTRDDAAGGTQTSLESPSYSPIIGVSSPIMEIPSLSQLSSSDAVGNAGVGNIILSPSMTPNAYYRSSAEKAASPQIPRKRYERDGSQPRLSSKLAAASDVLAYACGHAQCWPANATTSLNRFLTSQQLSDHWKTDHNSDDIGSNSFRCSLTGCGKGWKSINGLQYHLQISKAHFQRALASIPMPPSDTSPSSDGGDSAKAGNRPKKLYSCPHDQCRNQYKQLSGLRYHLSHGHSHELPAQLDSVPPALAQKFTQKMQKNANLLHTD